MADDKIQFAVSMTPCEMVGASGEGGAQNFISASEAYGSGGGSGQVTSVDIVTGGGANDGYDDGAKHYISAAAVADASGTALTSLAACQFIYLKHTGFEFSSATALSATANTTDLLTILITGGTDHTVIARLKAGEAIVLPMRGATNISTIEISSSDGVAVDTTAGTQGTIAVEYLAVAA